MAEAPLLSTFIAIGLIPVAFLYVHAYWSGWKDEKFHQQSGIIAIIWDLAMSIGYMLYRTFGGEVEGDALELTGFPVAFFVVHGTVAAVVIILEVAMLASGLLQWRKKSQGKTIENGWHRKIALPLFVLWWFAFLSGELVYLASYYF
ncbi:MAG: DUF420 domain-containing protein [Candidatus Hodarchaeota archaeon]